MEKRPLITIAFDGFSSSGKSTMAKNLAKKIGYAYIDTGAMYRAVTLYCMEHGLFDGQDLDTTALEEQMDNIKIEFHVNGDGKARRTSTATMWNKRYARCRYRRK